MKNKTITTLGTFVVLGVILSGLCYVYLSNTKSEVLEESETELIVAESAEDVLGDTAQEDVVLEDVSTEELSETPPEKPRGTPPTGTPPEGVPEMPTGEPPALPNGEEPTGEAPPELPSSENIPLLLYKIKFLAF